MKKVLVLGKGISGTAAINLLEKNGKTVVCINTDEPLEDEEFSFAVISPGIHLRHPFVQKIATKMEIISEVELSFRYSDCKVIAISGTNGKSSLVTYLGKMLNAPVCGNIGAAACEILPYRKKDEWAVLEMSSFQLDLTKSKNIDIGILLNVTDDHLDRYESYEDYLASKLHLADLIKPSGEFIREEPGDFPPGKYFGGSVMEIIRHIEKRALGLIEKADEVFTPLAHRMEFVKVKGGVTIMNDSKATNPAATVYAASSVKGPVVLLVGGEEKNSDFSYWKESLPGNIKCIICFGSAREKIRKSLQSNFIVYTVDKMKGAIIKALSIASSGDVLLLAPGCASYDEFSNYIERGIEFKREVLR